MAKYSLRWKLGAGIAVLVPALALTNGWLLRRNGESTVRMAAQEAIRTAAVSLDRLERSDAQKLGATLDALVANEAIVDAFVARDREKLLALARPIFEPLRVEHRITHWYFLEPPPSRTCFLRVHQPGMYGDRVDRATFTNAIRANGVSFGKELGKTGFALRLVQPLVVQGRVAGYVELGEEIDHFLAEMKSSSGDDLALALDKTFLDEKAWAQMRKATGRRNEWDDYEKMVVDATSPDRELVRFDGDLTTLPAQGLLLDTVARGGRWFARGVAPVRDAAGRTVGGLFVFHDVSATQAAIDSANRQMLTVSALIALAAFVAAFAFGRSIVRPIEQLTTSALALSRGQLDVEVDARGNDEVAQLAASFVTMADGLRAVVTDLQETSGTLSAQAEQLQSRAAQHSQGASTQAAAVQQTTGSMAEISQIATRANARAERVMESAATSQALSQKGSEAVAALRGGIELLSEQVEAIARANDTLAQRAQRIDHIVVKVKDIAEQSRFLALNTSLEATRAGDAGRGFTLVAVQMRELAEQSRDAALEVRRIVTEIQAGTQAALEASNEGNRRAVEALAVAHAARDAISGLSSVIKGSDEAAREIAEHTRQQSLAVEQVYAALRNISSSTQVSVETTREVEQASVALTQMSKRLREVVGRYQA